MSESASSSTSPASASHAGSPAGAPAGASGPKPAGRAASKAALRERFRTVRQTTSADAHAVASAEIVERLADLPELDAAETILAFWPLVDRGEVDVRPLVDALLAQGRRVALPVVTRFPPDAPAMEARRFAGRDALTPNRWGIPEPTNAARIAPNAIDLVLVPALGAGRNGHRVGHGAGYYDAYLPALDAVTVGVVPHPCLVDRVPAEPHDVPLDVLVTDRDVLRPSAADRRTGST